jgi:hypothetical protein
MFFLLIIQLKKTDFSFDFVLHKKIKNIKINAVLQIKNGLGKPLSYLKYTRLEASKFDHFGTELNE